MIKYIYSIIISWILIFVGCMPVLSAKSNPDAIYHLLSKSYKLNEDGSMDYRYRKEVQLFSNASFMSMYGETFILYNPDFQTLTINEAYVIRKDGSVVQTPANAFNPSLPSTCTDCERFNRFREMVVTHTALEYEATIVLDYTIHSEQPFIRMLMEKVNLYEDAPIEKYDLSVTVPQSLTLNYFTDYAGDNMVRDGRRETDSSITTHWLFTDLPQDPADLYLPESCKPTLSFTTVGSPSDFANEMSMQNSFMRYSYQEYEEVFDRILNDSMSDMEQVLAIRDYVADNIHLNPIPARYLNYIVASPHVVWTSHCGTALEKTLLLQSMLRARHYNATAGFWYENMMSDLESTVRVTILDKMFFLSVTDKNQVSLEQKKAPCHFITMLGDMFAYAQTPRRVEVAADINMMHKNAQIKAEVNSTLCNVVSPSLNTGSGEEPVAATAYLQPLGGRFCRLDIADGGYGCPIRAANLFRNRKAPVVVPLSDESYTYQILLPQGASWITRAMNCEMNYDFGSVKLSISFEGTTMVYHRELHLTKKEIPTKEYKKFRMMLAQWEAEPQLIFEK